MKNINIWTDRNCRIYAIIMQQFRAFVKKIDSHLNIEGDTILSDRLKKAFAGDLNNYDQLLVIEVGSDEQGIFLTDRLKEKFKLETFFMMDEFPRSICKIEDSYCEENMYEDVYCHLCGMLVCQTCGCCCNKSCKNCSCPEVIK